MFHLSIPDVRYQHLGIGLLNQQLEPFRIIITAGADNLIDPVSHSGEEFVHCLEGQVEYCVEKKFFSLEQGDSLLFDATHPHGYRNPAHSPAVILLVFQPTHDRQKAWQLYLEQ